MSETQFAPPPPPPSSSLQVLVGDPECLVRVDLHNRCGLYIIFPFLFRSVPLLCGRSACMKVLYIADLICRLMLPLELLLSGDDRKISTQRITTVSERCIWVWPYVYFPDLPKKQRWLYLFWKLFISERDRDCVHGGNQLPPIQDYPEEINGSDDTIKVIPLSKVCWMVSYWIRWSWAYSPVSLKRQALPCPTQTLFAMFWRSVFSEEVDAWKKIIVFFLPSPSTPDLGIKLKPSIMIATVSDPEESKWSALKSLESLTVTSDMEALTSVRTNNMVKHSQCNMMEHTECTLYPNVY